MELTASQLAELVKGTVEGDSNVIINNFAKIEEAKQGCLTFLANPKYTHFIYSTDASAVLVRNDFVPEQHINATLIRVADPYATLADLLNFVNSHMAKEKVGIEQPSFVSEAYPSPTTSISVPLLHREGCHHRKACENISPGLCG